MAQQYSTCFPEIATYDEIKKLKSKPKTLLIDVREPNELAETGIVPTSINIPRRKSKQSIKIIANKF